MSPLLSVHDLSVNFVIDGTAVPALDRVSFSVGRGERLGLVGESGSGKSITARAILGLIQPPGHVTRGVVVFDGIDLRQAGDYALNHIRGKRIALIPQDASLALNPVLRVGEQMDEILARHFRLSAGERRRKCVETLERMGLADPARVMNAYGTQLSGGMKQRVGIAMALVCDPELLIADDPTSAVDVTIQAQILYEFQALTDRLGLAVLFISHDLRVVSTLCSRIVVLYAGQVAEVGTVDDLLAHPHHPYTSALLKCSPNVAVRVNPLPMVPGASPDNLRVLQGCRFEPRCPRALARCAVEAPQLTGNGQRAACWNPLP
jgi:oligopeptide/dipeptide ABC transporter ATP-binding protein